MPLTSAPLITIVADNVEGNKVTFEIRNKLEEEEWMCAFTPVLKQRFIVLDRSKMYSSTLKN
jgi:predicted thioesterase